MRRVEVAQSQEVEVLPFVLREFLPTSSSSSKEKKMTKKAVKSIAKELGLDYDESHIKFARKVINAHRKS